MLRYKQNLNLSVVCNLFLILAGFSSKISGEEVNQYKLKVEQRSRNIAVITIDQQVHLDLEQEVLLTKEVMYKLLVEIVD